MYALLVEKCCGSLNELPKVVFCSVVCLLFRWLHTSITNRECYTNKMDLMKLGTPANTTVLFCFFFLPDSINQGIIWNARQLWMQKVKDSSWHHHGSERRWIQAYFLQGTHDLSNDWSGISLLKRTQHYVNQWFALLSQERVERLKNGKTSSYLQLILSKYFPGWLFSSIICSRDSRVSFEGLMTYQVVIEAALACWREHKTYQIANLHHTLQLLFKY